VRRSHFHYRAHRNKRLAAAQPSSAGQHVHRGAHAGCLRFSFTASIATGASSTLERLAATSRARGLSDAVMAGRIRCNQPRSAFGAPILMTRSTIAPIDGRDRARIRPSRAVSPPPSHLDPCGALADTSEGAWMQRNRDRRRSCATGLKASRPWAGVLTKHQRGCLVRLIRS